VVAAALPAEAQQARRVVRAAPLAPLIVTTPLPAVVVVEPLRRETYTDILANEFDAPGDFRGLPNWGRVAMKKGGAPD